MNCSYKSFNVTYILLNLKAAVCLPSTLTVKFDLNQMKNVINIQILILLKCLNKIQVFGDKN